MTTALRKLLPLALLGILAACTMITANSLSERFGNPTPKERQIARTSARKHPYWQDVKPILDNRCVVCHACYDAPCQLKTTAPEGLVRGASHDPVYHPQRIVAAEPHRLFEDAFTVDAWRDRGFFPVLSEYPASALANREGSLLYRMLKLHKTHPPAPDLPLSDQVPVGIHRQNVCPEVEAFSDFANAYPAWGMPYGMTPLPQNEYATLVDWLEDGATYTPRPPVSQKIAEEITRWETFFNRQDTKGKLVGRYLYEHLFLAHLYFSDTDSTVFFKLIRSSTPPGQAIRPLAARRPIDAPGNTVFYYRLAPENESIVVKTHLPYALNIARMQFWQGLFFNTNYNVETLPTYEKKYTENPFLTYAQLPVKSRYKFLLQEAQFSIMNFIKGPVCRGQAALNVIRDHFWVFFIDPDVVPEDKVASFLQTNVDYFDLPNADSGVYLPVSTWLHYSHKQKKLLTAKGNLLKDELVDGKQEISLNMIWNGGGQNQNAALTIFRHFDSATVEQGMIGAPPQTAWVINYSLLERIHYLLVASYDVYGNIGHQLLSRLYMDFLRMEGESNFLLLLPTNARKTERENWYRQASPHVLEYLTHPTIDSRIEPTMDYQTDTPKYELFNKLKTRFGDALNQQRSLIHIDNLQVRKGLQNLAEITGTASQWLPQNAHLMIYDKPTGKHYSASLLVNNAHLNITSLFREQNYLIPEENTITVTNGFTGAYPMAFFALNSDDLDNFVARVAQLGSADDYTGLVDAFGVRRTSPEFWRHSDQVHKALSEFDPISYGILDYNRLENR